MAGNGKYTMMINDGDDYTIDVIYTIDMDPLVYIIDMDL